MIEFSLTWWFTKRLKITFTSVLREDPVKYQVYTYNITIKRTATLLKTRPRQMCFPVNFLRRPFSQNTTSCCYIYKYKDITDSTGPSDITFYPNFNKMFDHLETMLTICRPEKVLSAGSLCGPLVPSPQSKCPKRTFMLPQKYHASVSNMLSKPLKCFM